MSLGDMSKDGFLSFDEFLKYMSDHEKKLWLVFKSIDVDDNGKMIRLEIQLKLLGFVISITFWMVPFIGFCFRHLLGHES